MLVTSLASARLAARGLCVVKERPNISAAMTADPTYEQRFTALGGGAGLPAVNVPCDSNLSGEQPDFRHGGSYAERQVSDGSVSFERRSAPAKNPASQPEKSYAPFQA